MTVHGIRCTVYGIRVNLVQPYTLDLILYTFYRIWIRAGKALIIDKFQGLVQRGDVIRGQGYLAPAAGSVQGIGGYGHAGDRADQAFHDHKPGVDAGPEMTGAAGQVRLKEIVWFDPYLQ